MQNNIIKHLEKLNISYKDELINFVERYITYVEDLCNRISNGKVKTIDEYILYSKNDTEESYLLQQLCTWLKDEEINKLIILCNNINESQKDKIEEFITTYHNILNLVKDDTKQLIDQLFFIPGQFIKDISINN